MSQLFAEYPLLLLGLEAGLALFLLIFIVIWTASGSVRRKSSQAEQTEQIKSHKS